jgi:hypothetical protein
MHLSGFDLFAWAASFAGRLLILFVLFARGRAKLFPFFTALIAEETVATAARYLVFLHFSFSTYQYCYWSLGILDEVLQLFVLYEVAVHVFCPTGAWARDVHRTFLGLVGLSAILALLLTWLANPMAPRAIQAFILRTSFFSAALMSELFVSTVVLASTVGLPWKTHAARIAQGLGAYSIVCVGLGIINNFVGLSHGIDIFTQLSHIRSIVWMICEGYWIVMLSADAPAPRELPEAMRHQIYTLQRHVENDLIRIKAWRRN